jgi:hypothetical protein
MCCTVRPMRQPRMDRERGSAERSHGTTRGDGTKVNIRARDARSHVKTCAEFSHIGGKRTVGPTRVAKHAPRPHLGRGGVHRRQTEHRATRHRVHVVYGHTSRRRSLGDPLWGCGRAGGKVNRAREENAAWCVERRKPRGCTSEGLALAAATMHPAILPARNKCTQKWVKLKGPHKSIDTWVHTLNLYSSSEETRSLLAHAPCFAAHDSPNPFHKRVTHGCVAVRATSCA